MSRAVMADDIDALRRQLDLPTIDFFGHSDGGAIAIEYAVRHAPQVHKLVLVDTAVHGDRDPAATESILQLWADDPQYRDAVQEKRGGPNGGPALTDEALERSLERLLPLYVSDPSRYLRPLRKSLAGTHVSAFAEVSQNEAEKAASVPDLKLIQAQTLIINGTVDWICPYPVAQRLHATLRNSRLSLYANKGHFPWLEAGPRFFAEVVGFLGS
jgi:proline iminopeptidase